MTKKLILSGLFFLAACAHAEEELGDIMLHEYFKGQVTRLDAKALDGARNKEEWEQRRPKLKEEYFDMLGLWPLPEKTPLHPVITGTVERENFRVEKLHFQSKPGLYVTGNLYLPKKIEGKLPTVLYVCGHADRGRDGNKTAYQHHGAWFATHGYVCLIVDTLQLSEIAGIHHGTYRENRWWWHSAGYTSAGVECWNGVRAIDYLVTRPEVDAERIGVTGISGGGAATLWIAAADERVKCAIPVSGMSDLQCYVSDKVINGHCDCMFMYNHHQWEWTTIAALVVPRPMLFMNSGHDTIFPMSGNERIRDRLERLYSYYTPKTIEIFDVGTTPGPHKDNQELRLMAYRWMNNHLRKDLADVDEPKLPRFDGKELRVFPEDKDIPADALNGKIDETFVPRAKVTLPENAEQYEQWRRELLTQLHTRTFKDWPEPASQRIRRDERPPALVSSEPGIGVETYLTYLNKTPKRYCVVVLSPGDDQQNVPQWAEKLVSKKDDEVLLMAPRGMNAFAFSKKNPPNYFERAPALLGRTLDTGRVLDVQAVARMLHNRDENNTPICVIGQGQTGIIAAYAALFESCITQVALVEPTATHMDGPHFLSVLRTLDVPHALGMLAPRALTIHKAPPGLEAVQQIYKAAGAEKKLELK